MSAKPEVELLFAIVPMKNSFNVKYIGSGKRDDNGLNRD